MKRFPETPKCNATLCRFSLLSIPRCSNWVGGNSGTKIGSDDMALSWVHGSSKNY